jgi:hypothetical protein
MSVGETSEPSGRIANPHVLEEGELVEADAAIAGYPGTVRE